MLNFYACGPVTSQRELFFLHCYTWPACNIGGGGGTEFSFFIKCDPIKISFTNGSFTYIYKQCLYNNNAFSSFFPRKKMFAFVQEFESFKLLPKKIPLVNSKFSRHYLSSLRES